MSQRERRDQNAAKPSSENRESLVTQAARSRMTRLTGAGVSALGASTMAFVVGGCLALGYFVGTWLDARNGTTHWMPIGVFVGLAASVREMFRTLRQLNAQTQRELDSRKAAKSQQIETQTSAQRHRVLDVPRASGEKRDVNDTEPETIRPRIFHVPPPPLASFDDGFVAEENASNDEEDELLKLLREAKVEAGVESADSDETKSK